MEAILKSGWEGGGMACYGGRPEWQVPGWRVGGELGGWMIDGWMAAWLADGRAHGWLSEIGGRDGGWAGR